MRQPSRDKDGGAGGSVYLTVFEPEPETSFQNVPGLIVAVVNVQVGRPKRYPELTGDTALQNRLHEFQRQEDRLVVARSDLISAVRAHNKELRGFPGGWVAALLNPKAKALTTFAQAEIEQPPAPARP